MGEAGSVHVVDDDPVVLVLLDHWLRGAGYATRLHDSAEHLLATPLERVPSCALVDLQMPGMGGLALQQRLAVEATWLPLVFLSAHGDIPTSVQAVKAGAVDFLTKPVERARLLASVGQAVARSRGALARTMTVEDALASVRRLTGREREVLMLAVHGLHNKEIARRLFISHRTVEIHKSRIRQKTGAENLVDLVHLASASGLEL